MTFAQKGNNKDEDWKKKAICHKCGEQGHIKPDCKKTDEEAAEMLKNNTSNNNNGTETKNENQGQGNSKKKDGSQSFNFGTIEDEDSDDDDSTNFSFFTKTKFRMFTTAKTGSNELTKLILLDNQSTVDLFADAKLLSDIHTIGTTMTVETNGGTLETSQKGFLKGHGWVWYHPDAITNILSLKNVKRKYRVTFDSEKDDCFVVHKPDRQILFREHPSGLYVHDITDREVIFLQTVEGNKSKYSDRQYRRAVRATEVYAKVGCPSINDYKSLIKNGLINNCPVTLEDIKIAEDIFGKDISALKGKTVRKSPTRVEFDYVEVPRDILMKHRDVILTGDIFFVQGYPFMVTLSRNIKFNTIENLNDMEGATLLASLDRVFNLYSRRGFQVVDLLMDMQFQMLKKKLAIRKVRLNTSAAKEHIAEIERFIRVIKERVHALRSRLPYKQIPRCLVMAIVRHVGKWLNIFCPKNSISQVISPRTLITGVKLNFAMQG